VATAKAVGLAGDAKSTPAGKDDLSTGLPIARGPRGVLEWFLQSVKCGVGAMSNRGSGTANSAFRVRQTWIPKLMIRLTRQGTQSWACFIKPPIPLKLPSSKPSKSLRSSRRNFGPLRTG
jgi:hypothetical protein